MGLFTPLGISNAQSATPLSSLRETASLTGEVGVLNVQRCNPNTLSVFNPSSMKSRHNPLQEVDTYIIGLPEGIPRCEAEFVKSFMTNGIALNDGAFGKTYINRGRSNVMKMIDLQKRYNVLLNYSEDEINSIIIGELKSEIEYYHAISSLCINVCKFLGYYYDIPSKTIYILMENCGADLFDVYARKEKPSLEQSIGIIKQMVDALDCLHSNGFAHRDIKPENITVAEQGKVLLIDFGFLTHSGDAIIPGKGTALYQSPENMNKIPMTFDDLMASDIYSLGVTILFMILPYSADKNILFNTIRSGAPVAIEFNNSNFTKRLDILEKNKPEFKKNKTMEECNQQLSRVFGLTTDSFFSDTPRMRISAAELKSILLESSKSFSLGGSKKRRTYKKPTRKGRKKRSVPKTNRRRRH